jgi:hypothetical protein
LGDLKLKQQPKLLQFGSRIVQLNSRTFDLSFELELDHIRVPRIHRPDQRYSSAVSQQPAKVTADPIATVASGIVWVGIGPGGKVPYSGAKKRSPKRLRVKTSWQEELRKM